MTEGYVRLSMKY